MAWVRLRQVALVASSLDEVVASLQAAFGLKVAYRDPSVAVFGLHNAVLPVGPQFIEVVSPRPGIEGGGSEDGDRKGGGTAAGRRLARLGGDGGYMVICHTDDQPGVRARAAALGVRVAFEADEDGYRILQLHPRDTGGSFLEVDHQPGGSDPWGPWAPAGRDWRSAVCTDVVDGIAGVTVASADVERTASVWASLLDLPVEDPPGVRLDNAFVRFVPAALDGLVGVTVSGPPAGSAWVIGGVRFEAAGPA